MRRVVPFALAAVVALSAPATRAAPAQQLQNLKWFVVAGIGQGEGVAFYQGVLDAGMAGARTLLQGDQGPADVPCCVDLQRASVTEVNAPALAVVDTNADYDAMDAICAGAGGGSCAFLVDEVDLCGIPSPFAVGCAETPPCDGVAGDDPTLVMVVGLEALVGDPGAGLRGDILAETIAHERGHNACLLHVAADPCQLMQAAAGGGCLDAGECGNYRAAGNATGGPCVCQDDALGTLPDATACNEGAPGLCSGGVCGAPASDASVTLFAAGATAAGPTDQALRLAGLPGGWSVVGGFAAPVNDLARADGRDQVFAVTADDALLRIDPASGATLATVAVLPGTGSGFYLDGVAIRYDGLAFDPGPTAGPGDDVLYAVRQAETCDDQAFCDSELVAIDPDDGATLLLGDLNLIFFDGVQSLTFDTARSRLYATAFASGVLYEIDPGCGGMLQFCNVAQVMAIDLPRIRSSVAYAAETDRLYLLGTQAGASLFYDSIDAGTYASPESIGLDAFTPGGLVVLPAPEPGGAALAAAGAAALAGCARRRRR